MSIIHISRDEAVLNFAHIITRVSAGDEVRIDHEAATIAVVSQPLRKEQPRLLSEIIAALDRMPSTDKHFAADVEEGIYSRENERLIDPWESF